MVKHTQNRRTLNEITRYIKTANQNGILKKSMVDMAKDTGYSNATIHRSIRQLEVEGLIKVIQTKSQRKPNTIIYLGPNNDEIDSLLQQAHTAVYNLNQASSEVQAIIGELQQTMTLFDYSKNEEYIQLQ